MISFYVVLEVYIVVYMRKVVYVQGTFSILYVLIEYDVLYICRGDMRRFSGFINYLDF